MDSILFSSHDPKKYDQGYFAIFSQFYWADFKYDENGLPYGLPFLNGLDSTTIDKLKNHTWCCCEQWMMAMKTLVFVTTIGANEETKNTNLTILDKILETSNQRTIKGFGRKVVGFDQTIWDEWKYKIVVDGNYMKFTQNNDLKTHLLNTQNKEIVEASPWDRIWGIGYDPIKAHQVPKSKWGQNLLGKAIMEVRNLIK